MEQSSKAREWTFLELQRSTMSRPRLARERVPSELQKETSVDALFENAIMISKILYATLKNKNDSLWK